MSEDTRLTALVENDLYSYILIEADDEIGKITMDIIQKETEDYISRKEKAYNLPDLDKVLIREHILKFCNKKRAEKGLGPLSDDGRDGDER